MQPIDASIQIRDKSILITGGMGFIGRRLASALADRNRVVLFDNLDRDVSPDTAPPRTTFINGDVLNEDSLREVIAGVDVIIHCAGIAGVDNVLSRPVETMTVNLLGTHNVLRAAYSANSCERVVLFSTSEVFGSRAFLSTEDDLSIVGALGEARWIYAVSKLACEHLAIAYHQQFGVPATVIRPFNVYGPGQVGVGALKTFVLRALAGQPLEVHGTGAQIRAWCYVDDLVRGVLLSIQEDAAIGESFNIGNPRAALTIHGLALEVVRILNSVSEIKFVRHDYADIELRVPSIAKAGDLIGFEPKVDLPEGILLTAQAFADAVIA